MGFPGKNTGVGSHFPSPVDLLDPETESKSSALQADSLQSEPPEEQSFQIITNIRGEGNGTPLQYSCLENPMGGGAS